jgi:hypothetical protein
MVIEWINGGEQIRNISHNEDWEVYAQLWKHTWQLRRTKFLDINLKPIHLLPNYVPELRRITFYTGNIPDMLYDRSTKVVVDDTSTLCYTFKDINLIWK